VITRIWGLWLTAALFGALANIPAIILPLVVPFLPGHIALLLLVRTFGMGPALMALPLVCLPVLHLSTLLVSLLQIGLLYASLHWLPQLRRQLILWYIPLHLLLVWWLLPASLQTNWQSLLWYNLLAGAMFWFNLNASKFIANLISTPQRAAANKSMAHQLANRLTLFSLLPATLLLAIILHAAIVLDLSRHLTALQIEQKQLANQISTRLAGYVADVSMLASVLPAQPANTHKQLLQQLIEHRPEYISALMTDTAGVVRTFYKADVTSASSLRSVADREYFQQGMLSGQPHISNTFIGRGLGTDPLIAVSQRLAAPADGVLALSVNLTALTNAIQIDDIEVSHRVLLDRQQQKIWATNDERPLGQIWSVSGNSEPMSSQFLTQSWFNTFGPVQVSQDGMHFLLHWTLPNVGWQLKYFQDTDAATSRYQAYVALTILLAFGMLKLNAWLAQQFAGNFTQVLSELAAQASRWHAGLPLSDRPVDSSASEINSLALTLRAMQQRVSDSYQAQQQALQQLVELNAELEQRVLQRTEELATERDRAQHLASVKSRFLANMSHEIRTPITVISGFAEQLGQELSGEAGQMLDKISLNSRYLQQLVDDILDTARIEEGKMQIVPEAFVLGPLLDEICQQISPLIEKKHLQLLQNYQSAYAVEITADPFRLRQILLNLTSNAIKFTAQGQIRLIFTLHATGATLSVSDDGIGIDEAQQQHLFAQFSQADSSTSRHFGGSGLGLYISRQLAQAMQMDISLESRPQCGATFSLQLPAHLCRLLPEPQSSVQKASAVQLAVAALPVAHILLVDDVADIRALLVSYLRNQPVDIKQAASGHEALQLYVASTNHPFDLIVLDQQMPGLDGVSTAQQLRKMGCDAALLLLSADVLGLPASSEALFNWVMTKPISQQLFIQALADLLQQHSPFRQPTATDPEQDELAQEYRQSFALLQDKLMQADISQLTQLAHQIKGTSACFGMMAISAAALQLQQQAKAGAPHQQALDALLTLLKLESLPPVDS
jgi:signal transduction histidine kinase/DNA-binding NarL/FixJ family response regulator